MCLILTCTPRLMSKATGIMNLWTPALPILSKQLTLIETSVRTVAHHDKVAWFFALEDRVLVPSEQDAGPEAEHVTDPLRVRRSRRRWSFRIDVRHASQPAEATTPKNDDA